MNHTVKFLLLLFPLVILSCNGQNNTTMSEEHPYTNDLINETSPYLLQHAHNPVNWQAWNDEALKQAQEEDKLIIISVGYAACHWCHVMEHESFEDSAVAKIMNEHFVTIKVDREERPDIDQIYMEACQLINGSGGWPLNAIALPDGRPIFAGTYFPKDNWIKALEYFVNYYPANKEEAIQQAIQVTAGIAQSDNITFNEDETVFNREDLDKVWSNWKSRVDFKSGGRTGAPKFPMPSNWEFLMRYNYFSGDEDALKAVEVTLDKMQQGGIYDHVGGGFARYSTDGVWKVPHFEKMMYDNGQLMAVYSQAYAYTKNENYKRAVYETFDWLKREMTDKSGGFYSSLDADSEGVEGKFYVWTEAELDEILGKHSDLMKDYWNVKAHGNWEESNILFSSMSPEEFAEKKNMSVDEFVKILDKARESILKAREERIRPGLDDKILTSWNALMLKGLVDAYKAFGDEQFLEMAEDNGEFILKNVLKADGRLDRNYKNGNSTINGFLDDYSFTIEAFIALYEVSYDEKWLNTANDLADYAIEHFYDDSSGMFFYTSDMDPALIARKKETADNVIPGSNSSMAKGLYLLSKYGLGTDYKSKASTMLNNMYEYTTDYGAFYSNWAILMDMMVHPPYEIAIVGKDYADLTTDLQKLYLPNAIYLGGKDEGSLELLEGKLQDGETFIYVCQDRVCKMPVQSVEDALPLITKE